MTRSPSLPLPVDQETFTIGEVSRLTGVKPHVLRYWESSFRLLRPSRRGSGHRRFSRGDVETIGRIRELVYDRRLTLAGAKRQLRDSDRRGPVQVTMPFQESAAAVSFLKDVRKELLEILNVLKERARPS